MDKNKKQLPTPEEIEAKNKRQLANFQKWRGHQEYAMEHQWRIDNGFLPFESHVQTLAEWRDNPIRLASLADHSPIYLKENKRKLAEQKENEKNETQ